MNSEHSRNYLHAQESRS